VKVLVTGATGYVGSAIAQACISAGLDVRLTDRSATVNYERAQYQTSNLLDENSLAHATSGVDVVVHAAGLAHQFGGAGEDTESFNRVNVQGTANLCRAAIASGVRRLVLISSVSVYGPGAGVKSESHPCQPEGAYAKSKYEAEKKASELAVEARMPLTILRLATVYGEGDPGNVGRLIRALDKGRFLWIGDGSNSKSLIHRDDVARACLAVVQKPAPSYDLEAYNVTAPPCTMSEVVNQICVALSRRVPRLHVPSAPLVLLASSASRLPGLTRRLTPIQRTLRKWLEDDIYDGAKFEQTFKFKTAVSISEGINREVAWHKRTTARTT
jgi:nucleoside-diphosphate-sugar epimerase